MTAITQHHDLIELRGLRASAAPVTLRALGGYLGCRVNDRTIFHLDEIGQASGNAPFQAIPFARPEDAEYLAAAWNAVPDLLNHIDRLTEDNVRLREALGLMERAAYPVATEINARGHNWSEAYLDQALPIARQALTPAASEGK